MRTWDEFFPDVLPDVLGCPEPTVERALLHAARDLCDFTKVWREDLDPIVLAAGTPVYDLELPSGADLVQVVDATLNGNRTHIYAASGTTLRDRQANTGRRGVQLIDSTQIRVLPTPAEDGGLLVLAAVLQPSNDALGLPDGIADDNKLAIATGALARLLKMNKAPWANPTLSIDKTGEFRRALGDLQKKVWRAYSSNTPRVRAQYF